MPRTVGAVNKKIHYKTLHIPTGEECLFTTAKEVANYMNCPVNFVYEYCNRPERYTLRNRKLKKRLETYKLSRSTIE